MLVVINILLVALLIAAVMAYGFSRDLKDANEEREALRRELGELRREITENYQSTCDVAAQLRDAQSDADYWKERAESWEEKYKEQITLTLAAKDQEIHATQIVADFQAQLTTGRRIYNPAPPLPEHSVRPQAMPKLRMQARDAVRMGEQRFADQLKTYGQQKASQAATEQSA